MTDDERTVSLAISEMRRSLDVGLAKIDGQLGILLHRADQTDRRGDEHAGRLDAVETRLRTVEQDGVTEADMDARARRIIAVLSLIATAIGVAVTVLIALIARH